MLEYPSNQDETNIRPTAAAAVAAPELDLDFQLTDNELDASAATTNEAERRRMSASMLLNNHAVPSDDDDDVAERKLREKLELELVSKEHEITALVVDRHQLQSTLIKVDDDERGMAMFDFLLLFRLSILKMFSLRKKN